MSWIENMTNHNEEYWIARVQNLIAQNTQPDGKGHGETDTKWITQLFEEIESNLPPPDPPYDGNMGIAARMGYILSLWFTSTQFAKCFDSHRPTYVRQQAFSKLQDWKHAMFDAMTNISKLPTYYPDQPWQHPFDPAAKGGDFL